MFYYNKIKVLEGSRECLICDYGCFLNLNYTYEPDVFHYISMMANKSGNIAILKIKGVD